MALDDFAHKGWLDNQDKFRPIDERVFEIGRRNAILMVDVGDEALVCAVQSTRNRSSAQLANAYALAAADIGGHEWPNEKPRLNTV